MSTVISAKNLEVAYSRFEASESGFRTRIKNAFTANKEPKPDINVKALNSISFDVSEGDKLAFIGRNGSGKTTILKVIGGVLKPTGGEINCYGNVNAVFDPGLGMDPEASGEENIKIRLVLAEVRADELDQKFKQIAEFSELGEALKRPLKTYSSGMAVRLSFSIATSIEPEIMVIDEWLSAGDIRFVDKALKRMKELVTQSRALVVASHSQDIITNWCNRVIWLENGEILEDGKPDKIYPRYEKFCKE